MSNIVLPPDSGRAALYNRSAAIPLKQLRSDGSITAPAVSGVQVLPPSPERAELYNRAVATPLRYLYPDGSVYDCEAEGGGDASNNHAALVNLGFAASGHTGFASEADMNTANDQLTALWQAENTLQNQVNGIQAVIPSSAGSAGSAQLATQSFVNSSIQNMAARKITFDATGSAFPTVAALLNATTVFYQGQVVTPLENDYATVIADENHGGATSRYEFDGVQWVFGFVINNSGLTDAQVNAMNSGITAPLVNLSMNLLTNIDVAPTQGSNHLVLSGGVYSALAYKQDLINYSTTERATGRTDENGSPTYEITINGTTGAAGQWNNVGAAIPGFASFVRLVRGSATNTTGSFIPHGTTSTGLAFALTITSNGQLQEEHTGAPLNNRPIVATIEYTKTP